MNDKTFLFSTRSLVHLQAEQIRVHSHEVSKIWQRVDEERETRIKLEAVGCLWKHILSCSWHQTTNSRILFSSFHESFSQSFHWSKTEKTMFCVVGMSIEKMWRNDEFWNFHATYSNGFFWSTKLRQPRQCRDSCTYYIIFQNFVISSHIK